MDIAKYVIKLEYCCNGKSMYGYLNIYYQIQSSYTYNNFQTFMCPNMEVHYES